MTVDDRETGTLRPTSASEPKDASGPKDASEPKDASGPKDPALAEARRLINRWGYNATAYQILNPGIERWFSPRHDAVVGYVTYGRHRVVAGSPVSPPEQLGAVIEAFEADTHRRGLWTCYFAADDRLARRLERRGPLDRILLGAQPVWDPAAWPAILDAKASLRAQLYRARNKGVAVACWDPGRVAARRGELQRCLGEWLDTRGLPTLHFLVEPETLGRLYDRRIYVAELAGRAVGFVVASPVPARRGWLIEQFVRGHGAPNGTTELMLDAAWRDLAATGAAWVTLGLSPLSTRADVTSSGQALWLRLLLGWMRAHGRRFYNFDGLDAFKAKFQPARWEPIFAITSERRLGPGTLWAITGAFATMSPPRLVLRALGRAAAKEIEWLGERLR